jgi:hypothetical protein
LYAGFEQKNSILKMNSIHFSISVIKMLIPSSQHEISSAFLGGSSPLSEEDSQRRKRAVAILDKVQLKPDEKPLTMKEIVEECRIVRAELCQYV